MHKWSSLSFLFFKQLNKTITLEIKNKTRTRLKRFYFFHYDYLFIYLFRGCLVIFNNLISLKKADLIYRVIGSFEFFSSMFFYKIDFFLS
jgi:hypothetical protein